MHVNRLQTDIEGFGDGRVAAEYGALLHDFQLARCQIGFGGLFTSAVWGFRDGLDSADSRLSCRGKEGTLKWSQHEQFSRNENDRPLPIRAIKPVPYVVADEP